MIVNQESAQGHSEFAQVQALRRGGRPYSRLLILWWAPEILEEGVIREIFPKLVQSTLYGGRAVGYLKDK